MIRSDALNLSYSDGKPTGGLNSVDEYKVDSVRLISKAEF